MFRYNEIFKKILDEEFLIALNPLVPDIKPSNDFKDLGKLWNEKKDFVIIRDELTKILKKYPTVFLSDSPDDEAEAEAPALIKVRELVNIILEVIESYEQDSTQAIIFNEEGFDAVFHRAIKEVINININQIANRLSKFQKINIFEDIKERILYEFDAFSKETDFNNIFENTKNLLSFFEDCVDEVDEADLELGMDQIFEVNNFLVFLVTSMYKLYFICLILETVEYTYLEQQGIFKNNYNIFLDREQEIEFVNIYLSTKSH